MVGGNRGRVGATFYVLLLLSVVPDLGTCVWFCVCMNQEGGERRGASQIATHTHTHHEVERELQPLSP